MTAEQKSNLEKSAHEAVDFFQQKTKYSSVDYEIKDRADGAYLILKVLVPRESLFRAVSDICELLPETNEFRDRITIKKSVHPSKNRLSLPETSLLKTVLTESLTVSRTTFGSEFFERYIRSVSGAEEQITASSNHIVLGRRGSGKSCLLLYALHVLERDGVPYVWVAMQTYEGRSDFVTVIDVFIEILRQILNIDPSQTEIASLANKLEDIEDAADAEHQFDRIIPKIRRSLSPIVQRKGRMVIFLDDIHVLDSALQPLLLAKVYAISRDNQVFLKISGIEQLTNNWDPAKRKGLETPGDAQIIPLDYNLTMPDKSLSHIDSILNAHAKYVGLPSIQYICGDGVLDRLVWVAAGVPRDALSIFLSAISRASLKSQRRVSITSINEAASLTADVKLSDIARDAYGKESQIKAIFAGVREFCVSLHKKNAFLVEIGGSNTNSEFVKKLIALRLLHILHEGVTPNEAGRRYMALMLDYGFYVGIRAARSVDLFQKEPVQIAARDLRGLPILQLNSLNSSSLEELDE